MIECLEFQLRWDPRLYSRKRLWPVEKLRIYGRNFFVRAPTDFFVYKPNKWNSNKRQIVCL